jgi:hypothetical protein
LIFICIKLLYFIKYNMAGESQIKSGSRIALKKFARTVSRSRSSKHSGGGHTSDHLPQITGVEESWNLVNDLLNHSSPINLGPPGQVGGKKKKSKNSYSLRGGGEESSGATFLPAQWNTPNAPLPRGNNANQIESAYGRINAVSGLDVNLAAFPGSSMQQTGGGKKGKNGKKVAKKATDEKPDKKAKKAKKTNSTKSTSLWAKIKSFF